ncbi:hypothetical protein [Scytonema sp. HK-05]|nr:hypothetical protein [Scytonema sp. HK-05]
MNDGVTHAIAHLKLSNHEHAIAQGGVAESYGAVRLTPIALLLLQFCCY